MSYAQLDAIADSVTPTLALMALACLLWPTDSQRQGTRRRTGLLLIAVSLAYVWMLLDAWLALWPRLGLDYSTHTAVALALVMFLLQQRPRLAALWISILLGYAALMRLQDYHTVADMLSTALAVGGSIGLGWWPLLKPQRPDDQHATRKN